ncbi:GNAT family N-acetyltransferase, partial [Candidatus Bipolaricaulota bacterium]
VQRLGVEDVALAREVIRTIKTHGDTAEDLSLGPANMDAWLSKSSNVLIAATDEGMSVGFALGYLLDRVDEARTMLFFYEIEVAIDFRCRGIGSRLVEAMKRVAREEGVFKMWVQTHPENIAARALYQKMGGVECEGQDLLYVWTGRDLGDPSDSSSDETRQKR